MVYIDISAKQPLTEGGLLSFGLLFLFFEHIYIILCRIRIFAQKLQDFGLKPKHTILNPQIHCAITGCNFGIQIFLNLQDHQNNKLPRGMWLSFIDIFHEFSLKQCTIS